MAHREQERSSTEENVDAKVQFIKGIPSVVKCVSTTFLDCLNKEFSPSFILFTNRNFI